MRGARARWGVIGLLLLAGLGGLLAWLAMTASRETG